MRLVATALLVVLGGARIASGAICVPPLEWSRSTLYVQGVSVDAQGNRFTAGGGVLAKYNVAGALQWAVSCQGPGQETAGGAYAVAARVSGSAVVVGTVGDAAAAPTGYVRAFNAGGSLAWSVSFPGVMLTAVAAGPSTEVAVAGFDPLAGRLVVTLLTPGGTVSWTRTSDGGASPDLAAASAVAIGLNGRVVVSGVAYSAGKNGNLLVESRDASGSLLWRQTYDSGGSRLDEGWSVAVDRSGNVFVAGEEGRGGAGGADWIVRAYDAAGGFLWHNTVAGAGGGNDAAYAVAADAGNLVAFAGAETDGAGTKAWNIRLYDSTGAPTCAIPEAGPGGATTFDAHALAWDPWGALVGGGDGEWPTPYLPGTGILRSYAGAGCGTLATPQLTVAVNATPAAVGTGMPVTYRFVVTNTGWATITSLVVTDTLPAKITDVTVDQPAGFTALGPANVGSGTWYGWTGAGPLAPGASFTFTITGTAGYVLFPAPVCTTPSAEAASACPQSATRVVASTGCLTLWPPTSGMLSLTRTPSVVAPGDTITWTLAYSVLSASPLSSLVVTDTLPAYAQYVVGSGNPAPDPGWDPDFGPPSRLRWTIPGPFGLTATGTISFQATADWGNGEAFEPGSGDIAAPQGAVLTDAATLSWVGGTGSVSASASVDVDWFDLTKSATGVGGGEVVYTISARNRSALRTWWNVNLWDSVPANLDAWGAGRGFDDPCLGWTMTPGGCAPYTPSKTVTAGVTRLNWAFDLPPGASATVVWKAGLAPAVVSCTLVDNVVAVRAAGLTNIVGGHGSSGPAETAQSSSVFCRPLPPPAALAVLKRQTGGGAAGSPVTWSIDVANTGGVTLTAVTVVDTVATLVGVTGSEQPAAFLAPTAAQAAGGTRYVWSATGLSFQPGTSFTFTLTGIVGEACAATTVGNTAFVSATGPGASVAASSSAAGFFVPGPVFAWTVSVTATTTALPGAAVTYRIVVLNTGEATISNLTIVDTVPDDVTNRASAEPGVFGPPTFTLGGGFVWSAAAPGLLAPGQTLTLTITGAMKELCFPRTETNATRVWADIVCTQPSSQSTTASFLAPGTFKAMSTTSIVTTTGAPGAAVTYRIIVVNTGTSTFTSVSVTDTITVAVSGLATQEPAGFTPFLMPVAGGTQVSWSGPVALGPGEAFTFTITGLVAGCATGTVADAAEATGLSPHCGSIFPSATAAPAVFTASAPALAWTVSDSVISTALPGAPVTYRITIANTGGATITGLTIVDTIDARILNAVAAQPAPFGVPLLASVASGTRFVWSAGAAGLLPPGQTLTITITGVLQEVCASPTIPNVALVTAVTSCPPPASQTASAPLATPGVANGIAVSSAVTATGVPGSSVSWRIVVANTGTGTLATLNVTDTIPAVVTGLGTFQPAGVAPTFTPVAGGTLIVWQAAVPLAPGAAFTFTVTGALTGCAGGPVTERAQATGLGTTCGWTSVTGAPTSFTAIGPVTALGVSLAQTPAAPAPGAPVTWRIVVANAGTATLASLTVVDTLSGFVNGAATTQPAAFGAPVVTPVGGGARYVWSATGLTLTPGASYTFTITGTMANVRDDAVVSHTAVAAGVSACAAASAASNTITFTLTAPPEPVNRGEVKIVGGLRGYVNPRNGEQATIILRPDAPGEIVIRIYNQDGLLLWRTTQMTPGGHSEIIQWRGLDERGEPLPPGLYPILIEAPGIRYRDVLAILR